MTVSWSGRVTSFALQHVLLLLPILLVLRLTDGFQCVRSMHENSYRNSFFHLRVESRRDGASSATEPVKATTPFGDDRRTILASLLASTGGTTLGFGSSYSRHTQQTPESISKAPSGGHISRSTSSSDDDHRHANPLLSLDQAFMVIEASCDRRFLHAVVSSDYNLMYRGISKEDSRFPTIVSNEPSDLLLASTYDSREAADYFKDLDDRMKLAERPIRPSNGHLATTSVEAARRWGGYAASVWPLDDDVHFAWLERGGDFWPVATTDDEASERVVVVDGVDCGRLSLDDALERQNSEILFKADRYLAIPVSMEERLISRLKSSFII
jgi:hypothetical protein